MRIGRAGIGGIGLLLTVLAGVAGAQDCADYSGTTRWVDEKAFEATWVEGADNRHFAVTGDTVVVCGPGGLRVFDVSRPEAMRLLSGSTSLATDGGADAIAAQGTILFAYVGYSDSLLLWSIADPARPVRLGDLAPFPDVRRMVASGSWLFAVAGTTFLAVDASDPLSPALAAELALPAAATDLAVSGALAAVATDAALLAVDVSNPRSPRLLGACADAGPECRAVALQDGLAYVAGRWDFVVVDLSDPLGPHAIGRVAGAGGEEVAVEGTRAVTTGVAASRVKTLDVSDPARPRLVSTGGAYMAEHYGIALRGEYAFTVEADLGGTVRPFASLVAYHLGQELPPEPVVSHPWAGVFDADLWAGSLDVAGDYLRCLSSFNVSGPPWEGHRLDVLRLGAAGGAELLGSLTVDSGRVLWDGAHAYLLGTRFEVVDLSDPAHPHVAAAVALPAVFANGTRFVTLTDRTVTLVAADPAGTRATVDVTDPEAPVVAVVGTTPWPGRLVGKSVVSHAGFLYGCATYGDSLVVVDARDLAHPTVVATLEAGPVDWSGSPLIANDHLWLTGRTWLGDSELLGYDLSDPAAPALVSRCATPAGAGGPGSSAAVAGDFLLLQDGRGAFAVDVSNPAAPVCVGMICDGFECRMARWGDRAVLVGCGEVVSAPLPCTTSVPVSVSSFSAEPSARGVTVAWSLRGSTGDFWLIAGRGTDTWTVPFTVGTDCADADAVCCTARDTSPLLAAGGSVTYSLERRESPAGPWQVVARQTVVLPAPERDVAFLSPHPNPFNPVVRVPFVLAHAQHAKVEVYDLKGRRVATLVDGAFPPGRQEVTWRGHDAQSSPVASGSYWLRIDADGGRDTRRVTLLK